MTQLSEQLASTPPEKPASPGPGIVDRLFWRTIGAPAPRARYAVRCDVPTRMRDGVVLLSDLYTPATGRARSTVLIRTPYRRAASHRGAEFFAAQGFNVLLQACRGTDGSDGPLVPMVSESEDGNDTVRWMETQPWWTGDFITYGVSYLGYVQYALLREEQPRLRGMIVEVAPFDFAEVAWGRGAFDQGNFLAWSAMMSRDEPVTNSMIASIRAMKRQEREVNASIADHPGAGASTQAVTSGSPWHATWVAHPDVDDPFWNPFRHRRALENIDAPVLLSGAWQDLFLRQTLHAWEQLERRGVDLQVRMYNGVHNAAALRAYQGRYWRAIGEWLDRLQGDGAPVASVPRFVADVGGTKKKRVVLDSWPPRTSTLTFALNASGELDSHPSEADIERFEFDPAAPTRSVGGHTMGSDSGVRVNNSVEAQADVLTFTSAPRDHATLIAGTPRVSLKLSVDQPVFDIFVRLCDVDGRGRSRNITDEILRFRGSGAPTSKVHAIELQGTVHELAAGHRLRLQVSGGAVPRFSANDENGDRPIVYELSVGVDGSVLEVPTRQSEALG